MSDPMKPMKPGPVTEALAEETIQRIRERQDESIVDVSRHALLNRIAIAKLLNLPALATPAEIEEGVRIVVAVAKGDMPKSAAVSYGIDIDIMDPVGPNGRALALAEEIAAAVRKTAAGLEVGEDLLGVMFSAFRAAQKWAFSQDPSDVPLAERSAFAVEDDTKALKSLRLISQDEWQKCHDRATAAEAKAGETKSILLNEINRHAGAAAQSRAELRLIQGGAGAPTQKAPAPTTLDGKSFLIGSLLGAMLGGPPAPTTHEPKGPKGVR